MVGFDLTLLELQVSTLDITVSGSKLLRKYEGLDVVSSQAKRKRT